MADSAASGEARAKERNDAVTEASEGADSAVVEAPPQGETPDRIDEIRNEAVAAEVVGPTGGNDLVSPAPAVSPAAPAATGLDPLEAVIAKYTKMIDEIHRHDPLE